MFNYNKLPKHLRRPMQRYLEEGKNPGTFLAYVICNDLRGAFYRATNESRYAMWNIVRFMHQEVPAEAWGDEERYEKWMERGGLNEQVNT